MKMKRFVACLLLLVLCAGVKLQAQNLDLKVVKETKAKAEKGDAAAQYNLGQLFAHGEYIVSTEHTYTLSVDLEQAIKWLSLAFAQDYKKAKKSLSEIEQIEMTRRNVYNDDMSKANKGDADAEDALGHIYDEGEIVSRDIQQAAKWYRKAAEQGNPEAQYNLGLL